MALPLLQSSSPRSGRACPRHEGRTSGARPIFGLIGGGPPPIEAPQLVPGVLGGSSDPNELCLHTAPLSSCHCASCAYKSTVFLEHLGREWKVIVAAVSFMTMLFGALLFRTNAARRPRRP